MTFDKPFDRITVEADKMGGKPRIRGLHLPLLTSQRFTLLARSLSEASDGSRCSTH